MSKIKRNVSLCKPFLPLNPDEAADAAAEALDTGMPLTKLVPAEAAAAAALEPPAPLLLRELAIALDIEPPFGPKF